jgi:hypothetical protein
MHIEAVLFYICIDKMIVMLRLTFQIFYNIVQIFGLKMVRYRQSQLTNNLKSKG